MTFRRYGCRVLAMSNQTSSGGVGFAGLLTIVFIVLKLIGEISWSWWWVLSPLWISWVIGLFVLAVIGIVLGIVALFDRSADRKAAQRRADMATARRAAMGR